MADQYGSDFMTIVDDDGTEYELEVLSTLEYNGFTYLAVIPAGADEAFQGVPLGKAQPGGTGVDMDDFIVSYAKCGSAHQIQHFCGIVKVFHDDPPHGI